MNIAVTYENGNVFQHFGHTEKFKVYDVEDNKIMSTSIFNTNGTGHEALAGLLGDNKVDVLICGGMGEGAKNALADAGIEVVSGAKGNADEAVEAYLAGALESQGVNCDHHDHEEYAESGCGGSCGSCGGCGGAMQVIYEGPNAGKTVAVHYKGTLNDGSQFDSSYDRQEPLIFVAGTGRMIKGFDIAVLDMTPGEKKSVRIAPEEAYGMPDPRLIRDFKKTDMPGSENLSIGQTVNMQDNLGRVFPVRVTNITEDTITFDANHELAGQELNFEIELLSVQ